MQQSFSNEIVEQVFSQNDSVDDSTNSSYTVIGTTKRSIKERRLRSQKTFVQKVFYELTHRLQEKELEKLTYLSFYEELCMHIDQNSSLSNDLHGTSPGISPYYQGGQQSFEKKSPHASLKKRFQRMAAKRKIKVHAKDFFQLACTLETTWEYALRLEEHQQNRGALSFQLAERLVQCAKELPLQYSLFNEQKIYLHTSSPAMNSKELKKKLKKEELEACQKFLSLTIEFGFEYFGLSDQSLQLF